MIGIPRVRSSCFVQQLTSSFFVLVSLFMSNHHYLLSIERQTTPKNTATSPHPTTSPLVHTTTMTKVSLAWLTCLVLKCMLPLEDWSGVSRFRSWRAAQSLERRYVLQYDNTVRLMSYCNELCVLTPFRLQFAQKCAKLITTYEFDGIDIDWEFPSTPEDMSNYSLLLFEVRQALDIIGTEAQATKSYGLTATLPCSQESLDNIDVLYLDTVLSEFNLMTIDFHGGWEPTVGANAPLYNQDGELGIASVDSCINAFVDKGASKGKINIGLPFYGRSFGGATHIGDECSSNWEGDCSDIFTWPGKHGVPQYHEIHKKLPEMTAEFDTTSKTQLAYNEHGVLSYEDERSICLKAQYR